MQQRVYKRYLLAVLMTVVALSYMERAALGILLNNIKMDLHLSDAQLGLVTGFAYALFFSVMGIPIARWADRGHRVWIIVVTMAIWSVSVALCAIATSFTLLLAMRIGAAIAEAGSSSPANSLIPDYFDRAERPRAASCYMLGIPLGNIVGAVAGGWLNDLYGWRTTFFVIALPGVALTILAAATLEEPRKLSSFSTPRQSAAIDPSLKQVMVMLWTNRTLRHISLCYVAWNLTGCALSQWLPAFFVRSHGMETAELGTLSGLVMASGGLLGTWLGGEWSSRYASSNERLQLLGTAVLFCFAAVFYVATLLVSNRYAAFGMLTLGSLALCAVLAPLLATVQTLVSGETRATAIALSGLLPTFIGMGLGPSAVGILSDLLHQWAGEQSLRYALLIVCPGFLWAAWHLREASLGAMPSLTHLPSGHNELGSVDTSSAAVKHEGMITSQAQA